MRAHLVQLDIVWEDKQANYDKVRKLLGRAGAGSGDLVVLPEMFDTGFSLNIDTTADDDGRTLGFLTDLARDLGATVQGGRTVRPRAESPGAKATNRAVIAHPDGSVAEYAKIHPFSFGREPEQFEGGAEIILYKVADGAGNELSVCPAVCYDLRFPELFRIGLLRGAQAYAVGANWPAARQGHWRALCIARAIENQAFFLGVNRAGEDPQLSYAGGSLAVGPKGEVLGELGEAEGVLTVELDPGLVASWREEFPAWRDARLIRGGADEGSTW